MDNVIVISAFVAVFITLPVNTGWIKERRRGCTGVVGCSSGRGWGSGMGTIGGFMVVGFALIVS